MPPGQTKVKEEPHEDTHDRHQTMIMDENLFVRFEVGGTEFKVSRELIVGNYPDSMLAHLVSNVDPRSDTICIDRDAEHFRHILQYLRHGKVSLPMTTSITDFLKKDMNDYGIQPTTNSVVYDSSTAALAAKHMFKFAKQQREHAKSIKKEMVELEMKHAAVTVSDVLVAHYYQKGKAYVCSSDSEHYESLRKLHRAQSILDGYLAPYGLKIKTFSNDKGGCCLIMKQIGL